MPVGFSRFISMYFTNNLKNNIQHGTHFNKKKINPKTFSPNTDYCCEVEMLFYTAHHVFWNVIIFIFPTDFISGTRTVHKIMDHFPGKP
jgi:hypothetical protein